MRNKFLLLSASLLLLVAPARAQHMSAGAGVGTDGVSVELAMPLGSHVQLRAGYGIATGLVGYTYKKGVSVPVHPGDPSGQSVSVPLRVKLGANEGRILFNIHPGKGGFHFTAGFHLGSPCVFRGILKGLPSDYNTAGLDVDGYLVKARNGVLEADIYASGFGPARFAIKPYVGVGFGRAVADGRVGFSVDLGAQYLGKSSIWATGESLTGRSRKVQLSNETLENLVPGIGNVTQRYLQKIVVWPTLSAHIFVKLF